MKRNITRVLIAAAFIGCFGAAALPSLAQFQTASPLPQALLSHSAVVWNNRVYVAGGVSDTGGLRGGGGFLNNVYYCASLNPDGTMGAWQSAGNMPEFLGLGMHASVVHDGTLYVLGGNNMFGQRDVVYYSAINADGSLAGWAQAAPMPKRLMAHAAVVVNKRIYVMGGLVRSNGTHAGAYSAEILADRTLGPWRTEISLPLPLLGHRAIAAGARIYIAGGASDTFLYGPLGEPVASVSSGVYTAVVNADGALGPWTALASLPKPLVFHAVSASAKNLYAMGGYDGTGVTNAVYFAPFLADGTLGAWQALDVLPKNLLSLASVATENYIYSLGGGLTYIDMPQSDIYYLKTAAAATGLKAFVRITPSVINKKSHGKWVTAIVGLSEADVRDIDPATVRISAINGTPIEPLYADPAKFKKHLFYEHEYADRDADDDDDEDGNFRPGLLGHKFAVFKFSRQALQAAAPDGQATIRLEGSLKDARTFAGENTNWTIHSDKKTMAEVEERSGVRTSRHGVRVDIPAGAFPGNPELTMTVEQEDAAAVAEPEKKLRGKEMEEHRLQAVAEAVEFGPHGAQFAKPVTLAMPYDPAKIPAGTKEEDLRICYWNAGSGKWDQLPSRVSKEERLVRADTLHFSVYQVMASDVPQAAAAARDFSVGAAYSFPNPATRGAKPVLHVDASAGDKFTVKVYSASGRLVFEREANAAPSAVDGVPAYEQPVDTNLSSGVYYYLAEVSLEGRKVKKTGKFAVVR